MLSGENNTRREARSAGLALSITGLSIAGLLVAGTALVPGSAAAAPAVPSAASPAAAASTSALAGTYVALTTQARIASGPVAAGKGIAPQVTGVAGIPASGVGSVAVTITASAPTAIGALVAYPYATTRPGTTTLRFAQGQTAVTGTSIVRVVDGRIAVDNTSRSGSVQIAVDVSGYYRSGTASTTAGGIFHPVTPRRFIDTRSGLGGVRKARVAANRSIDVRLGGRGDLPATPGVAAVTVTAVSPTAAGSITGGRADEPQQNLGYVNFDAGETASAFVPLRLADGVARIVNRSAGTVDFTVDVVGYWTLGFAEQAGAFQTRVQTRVPQVVLPGGGNVTIELGGQGGVERSGVAAVVATLHSINPGGTKSVQAVRPGTDSPAAGAVLQFAQGKNDANVAFLPTTDDGSVMLRNTGTNPLRIAIDIDGYVPSAANPRPTSTATARYLSALTGTLSTDKKKMAAYGAADGAKGYRFVLLDVGAQSVSTPVLSKAHPGVSIANTSRRVAYRYSDLVSIVNQYVAAYLKAPGHAATPTIAIATNNDGVWNPKSSTYYAPELRGADWAYTVLAVSNRFQGQAVVRGADDIEPGFASTVSQAKAWESKYLATFPASTGPELYFIGSADGCPKTWNTATCGFGWTAEDIATLAAQPGVAAVPQVYLGYHATQWAELAGTYNFSLAGFLTEYQLDANTLSPRQAASAINRALASVGSSPLPGFVADFQRP